MKERASEREHPQEDDRRRDGTLGICCRDRRPGELGQRRKSEMLETGS